jgi:hypothetical protein
MKKTKRKEESTWDRNAPFLALTPTGGFFTISLLVAASRGLHLLLPCLPIGVVGIHIII